MNSEDRVALPGLVEFGSHPMLLSRCLEEVGNVAVLETVLIKDSSRGTRDYTGVGNEARELFYLDLAAHPIFSRFVHVIGQLGQSF